MKRESEWVNGPIDYSDSGYNITIYRNLADIYIQIDLDVTKK